MPDKLTPDEQAALKQFAGYIVTGRKMMCLMVRTLALVGAVVTFFATLVSNAETVWTWLRGAH